MPEIFRVTCTSCGRKEAEPIITEQGPICRVCLEDAYEEEWTRTDRGDEYFGTEFKGEEGYE